MNESNNWIKRKILIPLSAWKKKKKRFVKDDAMQQGLRKENLRELEDF